MWLGGIKQEKSLDKLCLTVGNAAGITDREAAHLPFRISKELNAYGIPWVSS